MSRLDTKELNWFEEGTRDLHAIVKGLADLEKQTNRQLNRYVPDLITLAEYYGAYTLDDDGHPLQFKLILAEQQKDKQLLEEARTFSDNQKVKDFLG
eukprot:4952451-Ditylum_brightwellii.AAC.1